MGYRIKVVKPNLLGTPQGRPLGVPGFHFENHYICLTHLLLSHQKHSLKSVTTVLEMVSSTRKYQLSKKKKKQQHITLLGVHLRWGWNILTKIEKHGVVCLVFTAKVCHDSFDKRNRKRSRSLLWPVFCLVLLQDEDQHIFFMNNWDGHEQMHIHFCWMHTQLLARY